MEKYFTKTEPESSHLYPYNFSSSIPVQGPPQIHPDQEDQEEYWSLDINLNMKTNL